MRLVSLSGKPGYLSLEDIGYGTGAGFKGWNCRHDWYPYFEGSRRMYSQTDLAALEEKNIEFPDGSMHTYYEAEQYQRGLERKIRETKRVLAAKDELLKNCSEKLNHSELQSRFDKYSVKLKSQEAQLKAFCQKTGVRPNSSRTRTVGFGRSTAQKAVGSANRHYRDYIANHNIKDIKTLADYYNVKYNDTERYELLRKYSRSINDGMMSPLVGFNKYEAYYYRVQNELVGQTTGAGVAIRSQSDHFLERVFGTKADPKHDNRPRSGVKLEDIKDALLTDVSPRYSEKNDSYVYSNEHCQVSLNREGRLIQTNPK